MKDLDVFLKTVVDGMKVMAQGIEVLAEKLETIAKSRMDENAKMEAEAKAARKAPAKPKKPVPKKKPATAAETVLGIINRSKKGVDTATLMKKTGFEPKKIHNIVYKLKKQGKIKSVGKGIYLKV
jgi:predicted Rossmann fold nucleotide-binding protein DprA/Smf involved in DNA uptake